MNKSDTRRLSLTLAAATLVPIGVLAYFGAHILRQDRDVEKQQARINLEAAAERVAFDIKDAIGAIEERLSQGEGIHFTTEGFRANRDAALLYQPVPMPPVRTPPGFEEPDRAEFQRNDLEAAESAYRALIASKDLSVRGTALLRLGHVRSKRGDSAGALQAYQELVDLGPVSVASDMAALAGRQLRAKVFEEIGALDDLRRETSDLAAALDGGGWPIDRATYGFYRFNLLQERWGAPPPSKDAIARTGAGIQLWESWRRGDLPPRGEETRVQDGMPVFAVWTRSAPPEHPVIWLAAPDAIGALVRPLADARRLRFSIADLTGRPVVAGANISNSVTLTPAETRLPFLLRMSSSDLPDGRRLVLLTGLATAFLLMIAAAYGLFRVTTREIALARQQSDFVSAVSHEFRTPLTSMRHLTDLLVSRAPISEGRKIEYYELLSHETERLHRMVESLLRFGRIDAGGHTWQLEPTDAGKLARDAVEEFRREPEAAGRDVACEVAEPLAPIRADQEALSRALWNLLENAAKYSEPGTPIRVFSRQQGNSLLLGVADAGMGIPPEERQRIFHKFVRGAGAKRAGVRGVGIGLALVQLIAEAHGGSVQLESAPGRGSTFTLVIPCLES